MALPTYTIRPALRCLRKAYNLGPVSLSSPHRFTTTALRQDEAIIESTINASTPPPPPAPPSQYLDPELVSNPRQERKLFKTLGLQPIGSRRRRAALKGSDNVPFEQMPYQCFQEARKVLQEDREIKLAQIAEMRRRIARWQNTPTADCGGEVAKKGKLLRMHKHLEELKILADINDPMIKKRFEDGMGDMNRPIYRYLADKKWRAYKRRILMQRISQMYVVPDMFQHLDPTTEVSLAFGRRNIQPGEFVDSRISEKPARLKIQPFDKGERLVTVAVMDADVPDEERDAFTSRCHFLAVNIPVSPTSTSVPFSKLSKEDHIVLPWLPPYAQKGAPYHRLGVFVLQQPSEATDNAKLDVVALQESMARKRDRFRVRGFAQNHGLHPIGVHLFRSKWDEGTDAVVMRAGVEGFNVEYARKKPEKLPYKKKDGERYR